MSQNLLSLTRFVNESPSAIAMFDREMTYLAASDRWRSDFNLDRDPIGRSHYDVFPELTDDIRAVHCRALAGETVRSPPSPFRRLDGSTQWLQWAVWPWLDPEAQIGGLVISSFIVREPADDRAPPDRAPGGSADGLRRGSNGEGAAPPPSRSLAQRAIVEQLRFGNLLLANLPDQVFSLFADDLTPDILREGEVLVDGFESPPSIWFPLQGLYSVVRTLADGTSNEVITGGKVCHGGLSIFLDDNDLERETICLMGGGALVLKSERFRTLVESSHGVREWFQGFVHEVMAEIMRAAVCASHHTVAQRIARWLLLASERSGADELTVHQETIAMLLGVRRTGVSTVLAEMRRAHMIGATRGRITIENRRGLIAAACSCYREDHEQTQRRMASSDGRPAFNGSLDVADLIERFERSAPNPRARSEASFHPHARG